MWSTSVSRHNQAERTFTGRLPSLIAGNHPLKGRNEYTEFDLLHWELSVSVVLPLLQSLLYRAVAPILSVGGLQVHFLEAGSIKVDRKTTIRKLIYDAYNHAHLVLPSGALGTIDIVVQVQPAMTLPEIGIGGYSPAANLAFIFVDPRNPNFRPMLHRHLAAMVMHELMHCARWTGPGYGSTLGEAIVSEGLAIHFEAAFRGETPWYAQSLDESALMRAELDARTNWQTVDYDRFAWFSPGGVSAPYRGYSLGFTLVARRMALTGRSCVEMCHAPASDF